MFKSIKTGVLAAILISTAIVAHAQKKIAEGTITYTSEYHPTAEQEGAIAMLPTEVKTKLNGNLMKFSFETGPATITIVQNFVEHNGLTLIDVPVAQMQLAVKMDKAAFEKEMAKAPKFSDFKATGEKKMMGAYNAEKYTYKDDKGTAYELWTTNDVELPAGYFGEQFKDVKGTLVKYTTFQQTVKTTYTLKGITEEKVGALSLEVPKGYELKTMEEIMAMQGGGE
ncbi:hypothetical protein [Pedobacter insulae]|uniref:DUF4412 domain-containing protein n=1 Tax=Pedobacter insulae TaxID=414048 RepID=A0A1I2UL75_9SPHI|nr:hypothetical protein [Pedobacter insulae]SFG76397.1 hypothetical protein SAMN04489864_102159 [Pedobacter insulae]